MAKCISKRQFRIRCKVITNSDWMASNFITSGYIGRSGYVVEEKGWFFWWRVFGITSTQKHAEELLAALIKKEVDRAAFLKQNPDGVVAYASLMNGFERLN